MSAMEDYEIRFPCVDDCPWGRRRNGSRAAAGRQFIPAGKGASATAGRDEIRHEVELGGDYVRAEQIYVG
jgi:hypothetical protein